MSESSIPEARSVDDILRLHQALEEQLRATVSAAPSAEPNAEAARRTYAATRDRLRTRLDEMTAERDAAVRRYDDDLRRLREEITSLDQQLAEVRDPEEGGAQAAGVEVIGASGGGEGAPAARDAEESPYAEAEETAAAEPGAAEPAAEAPRPEEPRTRKRRWKK